MGGPTDSFGGRLYNKGERTPFILRQSSGVNKDNQYFYIKTATVEYVDIEKYQMTIRWQDKKGVRIVPISFAHSGPASCLGALPERGATAIFAFYNEGTGKGSPLCVGYLPAGLSDGIDFNTVKVLPDALSTSDINEIPHKFRKLTQGEMIMSCALGSSIFLNKGIEFKNSRQNSLLIREDDQSIVMTSLNNFVFADGISANAGPAIRNDGIQIYDSDGNRIPSNASIMSLLRGKDNGYITRHGRNIAYGTQVYTEYRIDADELSNGRIDLNNINSSTPLSTRDPIVTFALGNYIGANKSGSPQTYGKLLKVSLFKSPDDIKGRFTLNEAVQNNRMDEPSILGMAYAMHFLKSSSFIGVDKEGHYYLNLNASVANPLGAGRSMSILAQGNLKEIWGMTAKGGNSWDLVTKGGVKWNIGNHTPTDDSNNKLNNRSIDITTSKGISIVVGGNDDTGFAKTEVIKGNVSETMMGNRNVTCKDLTMKINGLKSESIVGSTYESSDMKTVNVFKGYKETVAGEKNSTFGNRKTTIIKGSDELTVLAGNISETIQAAGSKTTTLLTGIGAIQQQIGPGINGIASTRLTAASYDVNLKAGVINIKTGVGTVTVSGTSVIIKGGLTVSIDAPFVRVGKGAPLLGALTGLPGIPTAFDPLVGTPFLGSRKVGIA